MKAGKSRIGSTVRGVAYRGALGVFSASRPSGRAGERPRADAARGWRVTWYARIGPARLLGLLRTDPDVALREISTQWFPIGGSWFREMLRQKRRELGSSFAEWFRGWFSDSFCEDLLRGRIAFDGKSATGYPMACELLRAQAAVVSVREPLIKPIRGDDIDGFRGVQVYFAHRGVKDEIERALADARSIGDICLPLKYKLYPPPGARRAALWIAAWCGMCGRYCADLSTPRDYGRMLDELYAAYPHVFYRAY